MTRKSHLLTKYGITEEQYEELFHKQAGFCPICQRHQSELTQKLCVDHNHKTGEIRGLLCTYCNRYIVGRHTDPVLLLRVSKYLEGHTGWIVPKKKRRKRKSR